MLWLATAIGRAPLVWPLAGRRTSAAIALFLFSFGSMKFPFVVSRFVTLVGVFRSCDAPDLKNRR